MIDRPCLSQSMGLDTRASQRWLGHRSITSTAVYTALAPNRFKDIVMRNIRIKRGARLRPSCAIGPGFESMLRTAPLSKPFSAAC